MGPHKENKIRFNLEKRTNTPRGKIIQNTDSAGRTDLESSRQQALLLRSKARVDISVHSLIFLSLITERLTLLYGSDKI